MKFTTQSPLHRKFATLFLKIYNYIENNNNANIDTNGEMNFLKYISKELSPIQKPVIFDVGANIGKYTETLIKLASPDNSFSFHLFEPLPSCVKILKKKFSRNPSINIIPYGVSDTEEEVTFYFDEEISTHASLYKFDHTQTLQTQNIQVIPLKKYIEENDIHHIHLLKIDVEGNEYKTLLGLEQYLNPDFIDYIQFEYGSLFIETRTFLKDFYELLQERGFRIAKLMKSSLQFRPWESRLENFTYANYIAVSKKIKK